MDLTQNYFELFGLPQAFAVNNDLLSKHYRQLQQELHPDKFVRRGASEQRLAVQFASFVNNAFQTLKSPLLRAEYLLELAGHPLNNDSLTIRDSEFLLQQMQWREVLADLDEAIQKTKTESVAASRQLLDLQQQVDEKRGLILNEFDKNFTRKDFAAAGQQAAQLHFVEKMSSSIESLEDRLLE